MNSLESISITEQFITNSIIDDLNKEHHLNKNKVISGFEKEWVHFKIKVSLAIIIITTYSNFRDWVLAFKYLVNLRKKFLGNYKLNKMIKANGKYYMGLYTPGWNDAIYKKFIVSQLNDFKKTKLSVNRFNSVFLAITKKCALQCKHCYEWENLNKKDVLSPDIIKQIVSRLQKKGVSQIQFSGGEPLLKMDTLVDVISNSKKTTNFWVATSGFKLTENNAYRLKEAGLTGVIISLDHFNPEKHNAFRGFKDAYYWVEEAVKNANKTSLVVALSVCVTNEFISETNLMAYMELAKKLGVSFVQFLEPKPVGHFANKNVYLTSDNIKILETFYTKLNYEKAFKSFPIITYHGFYQRKIGCFNAGKKGMYVDTNGDMNACPFCHTKTGNVLDESFEHQLEVMSSKGCSSY
ncbi:radical SAM protein [Sabulilitoribacter arenilitoris]|uniref:Radical SAM protein n=1 Tax=Wocania arenilitoris TaxID=2044858 RepID=A0AAE3JL05_9FLAO|nr:radical SAM protein [Wocania arenilitoris]MCF7567652.1 radical SAM protein [Wocania arenilitoris]